jgi:hypothetical protein
MVGERIIAIAAAVTLTCAAGCRLLRPGPSDQEVAAAVEKSPPAPPTAGPTYLAELTSVQIEERGPYNSDGKYWPARVRVKGGVKIKLTNAFQLGLLGDRAKETAESVNFVEEARLSKDDFGKWRVSYTYDPSGPTWRFDESGSSRRRP